MLFLPVSIPLILLSRQQSQLIDGKNLRDIADYLVLIGISMSYFLFWY